MQELAFTGSWWLPERPQRKLAGSLTLTHASLHLVLYDELREVEAPATGVMVVEDLQLSEADVVHGIRHEDNALVTLLGVTGYTFGIPIHHVTNYYEVDLALLGRGHAPIDGFERIDIEFDYLQAWVQPPSRVVTSGDAQIAQIRTNEVEIARSTLSDGATLRLYSGVVGSFGDDVANLSEYCALSLAVSEPVRGLELISRVLRPAQDLLMTALGRPVRLTEARLATGSGHERLVLTAHFPVDQRRPAPDENLPAHRRLNDVLDYRAPTLLTAKQLIDRALPLPLEEVLRGWFERTDALHEVLSLLLAPYYADEMRPEHRYASIFQSAEALHDMLAGRSDLAAFDTKEMPRPEHRARVVRVLDQLTEVLGEESEEDLEWARRVLSGRNDRSLPQKIGALLSASGQAGAAILAASPNFAGEVAGLRARVAHGGAGSQPSQRQWRGAAGEALRWLVRGYVLAHVLLSPEEQGDFWERLAQRPSFKRLVEMLATLAESSW
jgi:hypothetical protein